MRQELDDALCADFPILFRDRNAPASQTCMCWGFPGDGWEPLIRRCAAKLEGLNKNLPSDQQIIAVQVKEKFGGLRFYVDGGNDDVKNIVYQAISDAEAEADETCEECGAPGKRRSGRWIQTLCDACDRR